MPDKACFTYHAESDSFVDGIDENGTTVMAIDNLPCEFPRDASISFSKQLKVFVQGLCAADFKESYDNLTLPAEIKRATLLHKGRLTREFSYLKQFI